MSLFIPFLRCSLSCLLICCMRGRVNCLPFTFLTHQFLEGKKLGVLGYPWSSCHLRLLHRHKSLTLPHYSKTVHHFQIKHGKHVSRNNMHVYTKSHNAGCYNNPVMPLFQPKRRVLAFAPWRSC